MAFRTIEVELRANVAGFAAQMGAAGASVKRFGTEATQMARTGDQLAQTAGKVGLAMGVGLAASMALSAKAAIGWESAFAGVRKTIDATEGEFAALSKGIREMATRMPASANEIAAVAEAAGQLGVSKDAILDFSETMIQLGATTNLTADEAATAMARLANIMQTPQDEFDNLGAALVDLGNNGASTEADIVQMATRIASAGSQIGLTEGEVLGFANALSSVGIEAEAGGSAISRVMITARNAVMDAGGELDVFAETAGMSASEFQRAFQEDAGGALISFIEGLGRMEEEGRNSNTVLRDLELADIRVGNALRAAAGAGDLFRESLELGNESYEANSALTEEYARRLETTESQLSILGNKVTEVAISFGETMLPAINGAVDVLGGVATAADAIVDALGPVGPLATTVAAGVATLGGAFLLLAPRIAATTTALSTLGLTGPKIVGALGALGKAAGVAGAAFVALQAVNQWAKASADNVPGIDALTTSLLDMAETGKITGEMLAITGDNFEDLGKKVEIAGNSPFSLFDSAGMREVEEANQQIDAIDKSLARLVSRDPEAAAEIFDRIADAADAQGVSVDTLNDRFNDYGEALAAAEVEQRTAEDGTQAMTDTFDEARMSIEDVEKALDAYAKELDGILGMAFSVTAAHDALTTQILDLGDEIRAAQEAGEGWDSTLTGNSRSAIENRARVMELVGGVAELIEAQARQGDSSEQIQATLNEQKERLRETLLEYGYTADEIEVYLGVIDQIPADVMTSVEVTGATMAAAEIDKVLSKVRELSSRAHTNINITGSGQLTLADGGVLPSDARIQRPGTLIQWAEPETGGEAFIPMSPAKRGRSTSILAEVAGAFGYGLMPMANGGVTINMAANMDGMAVASALRGSTTGLDPEFLRRFRAYSAEVGPLSITSGFRSYAQQAALYQRYLNGTGNLAAPPGRSKHERGLAIDHSPRSTPAMRAVARRHRLHYPVRGEPWHVEPFANGGIRSFASGGILQSSLNDVRFGGALMGRAISLATAEGGFAAEDIDRVAEAWTRLALAVDQTTAELLLVEGGLGADEFIKASDLIIERTEQTRREQEEAAEEAKRAAQEAYEQQVEINNNTYALGLMSTKDHLSNLDRRMARERKYTDEWMALYRQREQVEREDYERRVEMNNNAFELGRMSTADHLSNLERRMARETELTDEWMALYRQREQVLKDITDAEEEAADALERRVSEFESWSDVTQRVSAGWGNSAAALTRNITDQVEMFTDWMAELDAAKAAGVSTSVIDMLGLDEGPQALGQLRQLTGASKAEIAALNQASAARDSAFQNRAVREAAGAGQAPVVNVEARVFVGNTEIKDIIKVELRQSAVDRAIAGSR